MKKKSLSLLKQKEIFEEIANEGIDEIQDFSKRFHFNNLVYCFKGEIGPKNFISFKVPKVFYRNIKDSYTTLEKAEENFKNIISDIDKQ